ncbi:type 1 glutamine amidotransferase [Edaphocola aurantiacus]|uniref:type 1 glutamine amidotransferase n=1 Tax=Edaphocola aurantiacus TaxID=2601682 RepID=UPI001C97F9F6|nr:type 1 glutamine amidotransferase [Edaphocola aurantiacus]
MNVHYLQHAPFEGLGYIETWLEEHQHKISATRLYETNHVLPDAAAIDALIILGGPMNVYEEDRYSWLSQEKALIKECIRSGKKVLGICLGAQLIAHCLGAKVVMADHKEIGWWPVLPDFDCNLVPWFDDLFRSKPTVFHWHGDQFVIPDGALDLLQSEANGHQAFMYNGTQVIGLQFHLELTKESLEQVLEHIPTDVTDNPFVQDKETILSKIDHIGRSNAIMAVILEQWLHTATPLQTDNT